MIHSLLRTFSRNATARRNPAAATLLVAGVLAAHLLLAPQPSLVFSLALAALGLLARLTARTLQSLR